ncbi:TPA: hypothetical protein U1C23_000563 [Streptococcus suis]|uniref:hypothetical protein n=1 Tax=Streptococcus suis TaxID=1307 RepID=UPI000CF68BD7|nr:hypothetical protein [Streptococcus suis]MBO3756890.1 hypothetical protein [Streptococcus suis]HEM3613753.1 hypothetical protein [Streptococcus suis]
MIYIDTEPYRKKKNYFGNRTTVEELYFKRILARYNDPLNLAELKIFIEQYIPKSINSSWDGKTFFRHLILLPPEELAKFAIKNTCKTPKQSKAIDDLKKVYTDYNILSKSIVFGKSEININQFLVRELGVTVCPYCNRNYINNRGDRFAAQMDHFYSKDEFPWLAVSLYNLIPSCGACNHIKGTEALNVHPFIKKHVEENEVVFHYRYKTIDDIEVVISTKKDKHQDIDAIKKKQRDIAALNLKEAYEIHGLDIQNMLEREVRYSESYRDELRDMLKIDTVVQYYDFYLSLTDDEIDRMIYGDVIFEEDIKNVSLGKFRKDIYQEIKKLRDY